MEVVWHFGVARLFSTLWVFGHKIETTEDVNETTGDVNGDVFLEGLTTTSTSFSVLSGLSGLAIFDQVLLKLKLSGEVR